MNWLKSLSKTVFCCLSLFITNVNAQKTLQEYKTAYPDYSEVILNDNKSYDISIENKGIKIIQDNHYESIILKEIGINKNEESFTYSNLVKLLEYDAYTIINDNGKERKIKVTQTNEKQAQESSVFHNDVKERQLIFPNLEAGAKKVYDYQTQFIDYHLLHKFIFGGFAPIENSTLEIKLDKEIDLGYKIFNDPNNTIEFSKTEKRGKWIYKWSMKNIKPVKFEDNSPGYLHIVPNINVFIKNYTIENKKVEGLENVSTLFDYYMDFIKDINKKENAELKTISQNITSNCKTDEEKVKNIFYWVKDNIKYIAFENGYEGFIPREGNLVYERKFGDCKDMASIITTMAKYANIDNVFIAWIGTREIPYLYLDLPTPSVDNHMIAVFKNGEQYVFLDATDNQTRFGIPTSFIQGKEALVNENGTYKIVKVPIVDSEMNKVSEKTNLTIAGNKLIGSSKLELNGYNRSTVLHQIRDASNKARFDLVKNIVLKGNNKFNLKNYTEGNITDKDKPYVINYNFELDNYLIKVDKEIFVNLFLDRNIEKLIIEKDRKSKYEIDYLTMSDAAYELDIPQNYKVKYLPKNVSIDNNLFSSNFSYEEKNNKIILKAKFNLKKILLDVTDFELWNETIKKLKSNYSETIILTQK